jgi:hypothetical protein
MNKKNLELRVIEMMKNLSPESPHPEKHFSEANKLVVDMAEMAMETMELMSRLHFLTEGYKEKDPRSAEERFREIIKLHE